MQAPRKPLLRLAVAIHQQLTSPANNPAAVELPTSSWQELERLARLIGRAREHGWYLAAARLTGELASRLDGIRNEPTEPPTTALPPTASPLPSPRLDADQPMELRKLRQREEHELSSYEWIDLERNTARIPIQRAMEIMAEDSQASQSPVKDRSKGSDQS